MQGKHHPRTLLPLKSSKINVHVTSPLMLICNVEQLFICPFHKMYATLCVVHVPNSTFCFVGREMPALIINKHFECYMHVIALVSFNYYSLSQTIVTI